MLSNYGNSLTLFQSLSIQLLISSFQSSFGSKMIDNSKLKREMSDMISGDALAFSQGRIQIH